MVDPRTPQEQPAAPRAGGGVRTGVAAFVAATALIAGGAAWPAFFGNDAPARATVQAAGPALLNTGPVATSYADLVQQVSPAVVAVRSSRLVQQTSFSPDNPLRRFFGQGQGDDENEGPQRERGLGSGVIVTPDGYILTNNHVVAGADHVTVDLTDGRSLTAKVVGTDPPSDLAVLKVAGTSFKTIPLADSEAVRVGDVVLAVGHPLGLGQTVTMGIISAKDRSTRAGGAAAYEDFLQTDAPINKGNSGGALVNLRGELVGINSQILSPTGGNIGIGFAIPSSMAHDVMTQLIEKGSVRRGLLGLVAQPITADLARSLNLSEVRGVLVASVSEDSAAERAGIQQGDVILALDGKRIDSSNNLRNNVGRLAPGTKVTLELLRDGAKKSVTATLGELPKAAADDDEDGPKPVDRHTKAGGRYGLEIDPLTPEVARELKAKTRTGVVVAGVDPAGVAAEAGFQAGDIITAVNNTKITDADTLKAALDKTPAGRPALVLIDRRGTPGYFPLERPQG